MISITRYPQPAAVPLPGLPAPVSPKKVHPKKDADLRPIRVITFICASCQHKQDFRTYQTHYECPNASGHSSTQPKD